ncbi:MAG: uroporphyrinogen-III synthase [bacterium]
MLITRSEPGASVLRTRLQQQDFAVICAPLVEIADVEPPNILQAGTASTPFAIPDHTPDVVIFLSAHASSRFVQAGLVSRIRSAHALAVGDAAARPLREQGLVIDVPATNTTEGLLKMRVLKQLTRKQAVWLISGVGGRATLAESLTRKFGCTVIKFELYERINLDLPPLEVDAVGAVVVSSEGSLRVFAEQWRGSNQVVLVVPSARLAAHAEALGFAQVHVSQNASPEATVDILQTLRAAKRLQ